MSLECIVWCPKCGKEHFWIFREIDASNPHVVLNRSDPSPPDGIMPTMCRCGGLLERKPS